MQARAKRLTRGIAVFAAALLSVTVATAAPSVAAGDPRSTAPSDRPARTPSVTAKADNGGVRVAWNNVPKNVATVDITRTEGDTTKAIAKGLTTRRFLDTTAAAGASYTYNVTVSKIAAERQSKPKVAARSTAKDGQVLGSATATVPAVTAPGNAKAANHGRSAPGVKTAARHTAPVDHRAAKVAASKTVKTAARAHTTAAHQAANIAAGCVVGDGTTVFTVPAGTTTWSPAACPNGVEVDSDVVVPAGATLVIAPGTVVYFNTATTGDDADGIANRVDLIARGGHLVLDGTPSGVIHLTSLMENPSYADTTPAAGDWGAVLGLESGSPNTTQVTFDNVSARYGNGVGFVGIAPAITSSRIEKMSGGLYQAAYRSDCSNGYGCYSSVLEYFNPATGSTVNIDHLVLTGNNDTWGGDIYSPDLGVNGFTLNLTNSSLVGNYPFWTEDDSAGSNAQVVAHVTGNNFEETSDGDAFEATAYEYAPSASALATPVGFASVTGDITNNTANSNDGGGFYVGADNYEGSAAHDVDYFNNHVRTYDNPSYNFADSYGNDGAATLAYVVSGGDYWSLNNEAWYDYAYTSGGRDALAAPSFTNVYLESQDDDGLYLYAESDSGNATASPTFTTSTINAYNVPIYAESYVNSGGTDAAPALGKTTVTVNTSRLRSTDDDGIDAYATNYGGSTKGDVNITNSNVDAYDAALYVENTGYGIDAGNSSSSNSQISGSVLYGRDDDAIDIYDYQYNQGSAFTTPKVTNSVVSGDNGDGLYAYAYDDAQSEVAAPAPVVGEALSAPIVDNSTVRGYNTAVYAYSEGSNQVHSYATPYVVNNSKLSSTRDRALESYADGSGVGDSKSLPYVSASSLNAPDDDAVEVYSYAGDGVAEAGGSFLGSGITGYSDGIYLDSGRGGTSLDGGLALTDPVIKATNINAVFDNGVDAYSSNDHGSAKTSPYMQGGKITAIDDYGLDAEANATSQVAGTEGLVTPSFDGVVQDTGDGVFLGAYDYFGGSPNVALQHVAGKFNAGSVSARWDYGFQLESWAYYSTAGALTNTLVNDVPVYSYDGIYSAAYTYGCTYTDCSAGTPTTTGPAVDQTTVQDSKPLLLESWWDWGFYAEAYSQSQTGGDATEASTLRGAAVRSYDNVYTYAEADTANATNRSTIVDNNITRYTGNDDDGITVGAGVNNTGAGTATDNSTVAGNTITNVAGHGINEYAGVPTGTEDFNALISGNTIQNVAGSGIIVSSNNNTDGDDVVHITRNVIDQTRDNGIEVDGVVPDVRSNTQSRSGWTNSNGSANGISVTGQPGDGGLVACNTVTRNTLGISYADNGTDPATNENNFVDQAGNANAPWNLQTNSPNPTDATGNWWGVTGSAIDDTINATGDGYPVTSGAHDETACRGGYEVDGRGAPHPYGPGTAAVDPGSSPYFPFDIARAIGVWGDGASGEVLDGFGAVHPFNGAPYLSGQPYFFKSDGTNNDIARDIALRDDGQSGYELDGYGKVWALGGAPEVKVTWYQYANDFARRMVLRPDGMSGYVITGDGVMHPFAPAGVAMPPATMVGSPGTIKDVIGNHDGHSGYVLGASGTLVPWNTAYGSAAPTTSTLNLYGLAKAATWFNDAGRFVLDAYGAVHPSVSNGLPLNAPTPFPYYPYDIARDLDGRA